MNRCHAVSMDRRVWNMPQVLRDEGEEAYFAAFEAQDYGNYRCLDEDCFVDAIETLAPGKHWPSISMA